ncbi:MAG: Gfo/Idh/MocA family oxidoreductase [Armatimonadetes bacterium]|nr:Gfo/Idh/MocA family oxidoreductase [Armatimonadota bacterium]
MDSNQNFSRRKFLQTTATTAAGLSLGASSFASMGIEKMPEGAKKKAAPSDKIVMGLIGCHGMGAANMRNLLNYDDCAFAAICDVDTSRMGDEIKFLTDKNGKRPDTYTDYRKMLERKDIDAVVIGSPDHWHALNLIHACEAGKDAYCEKPISHNFVEAKAMMAAKAHFNKVVQVGTWQRSTREFHDAIEYVRAGKLGRITHCRVWGWDGTKIGHQSPTTPPSTLDYDMWCGPAEMKPYQANKTHYNWRWVRNTGGGITTDWGVHMIDIALLGMSKGLDLVMPDEVATYGGLWASDGDDRDTFDSVESVMRFSDPDFVLTWSLLRDHPGKDGNGCEFISADGRTLRVWRGNWLILDANGKELEKEPAAPLDSDHWRNFLDCVKSREKPRSDLHSVGQTTIACHLSNMALYSGQTVKFDKKKMDVIGNNGKNNLSYSRKYRKGYTLKQY